MLPFIILMSMLCGGHAVDLGTQFVTAFPENLAYYYPATLILNLKITTFLPNTTVTVTINGQTVNQTSLAVPQVYTVSIPNAQTAEVDQLGVFGNQTVVINSNNNITVLSMSSRADSIQTMVVSPTGNLAMDYLVPSFNYSELAVMMNTYIPSNFSDPSAGGMDFNYRLIIINAENVNNTITVTDTNNGETEVTLGPFALTQMSNSNYCKVTATAKVAVIFTTPCLDIQNCKCNMVMNQLRSTDYLGKQFVYPAFNGTNVNMRLFTTSESDVHFSSGTLSTTIASGSVHLLSYYPGMNQGSSMMTTDESSSLRVIYPGLLIDLLPVEKFAGCFLVHSNAQSTSQALVIVDTAHTSDVMLDSAAVSGATWNAMDTSGFSYAIIPLTNCESCVIWHASSHIAVYMFENFIEQVTFYGTLAIVLNDEPDSNGCVAIPMTFQLANVSMTWQESRAYCTNQNLVLASPNIQYAQDKMKQALQPLDEQGSAWLGLRLDLVTSQWYWHSNVTFGYTYWNYNEPKDGLCVTANLNAYGNFSWSSMRCCTVLPPLCVQEMMIVGSITGGMLTETIRAPAPS